jgi:hypothetical protein
VVDLPRVPDGRVGMYNRAGAVDQGLGVTVNNARCGRRVVALAVAHDGGEFQAGYFIFGYIWVIYTHLGCFSAPGGAGGSRKAHENAFQKSRFPIRQAVPVGLAWARICSWASWASFFMVKNVYMTIHSVFTPNILFFIRLGE